MEEAMTLIIQYANHRKKQYPLSSSILHILRGITILYLTTNAYGKNNGLKQVIL